MNGQEQSTSSQSASCQEPGNIYVRGLALDVDDAALQDLFAQFGSVAYPKVMLDINSGLSRGFGFVAMKAKQDATRAIQALDGTMFRGERLVVTWSSHPVTHLFKPFKDIYIRHIPVECSLEEVIAFVENRIGEVDRDRCRWQDGQEGPNPSQVIPGHPKAFRIAYLMFRTDEAANRAVAFFHNKHNFFAESKSLVTEKKLLAKPAEDRRTRAARKGKEGERPTESRDPTSHLGYSFPVATTGYQHHHHHHPHHQQHHHSQPQYFLPPPQPTYAAYPHHHHAHHATPTSMPHFTPMPTPYPSGPVSIVHHHHHQQQQHHHHHQPQQHHHHSPVHHHMHSVASPALAPHNYHHQQQHYHPVPFTHYAAPPTTMHPPSPVLLQPGGGGSLDTIPSTSVGGSSSSLPLPYANDPNSQVGTPRG